MIANQAVKSKNRDVLDVLKFTLPIIFSNVVQTLFTAVDQVIVSSHGGDHVLAAIGATGHPVSMFMQLLFGVSIGASAVIAWRIGGGNKEEVRNSIHTTVGLGAVGGLIICLLGVVLARPILMLMKTPYSILEDAVGYLSVLSISFIPQTIYNFGAAALRAMGDTKRPLYFLAVGGVIKTGLTWLIVAVWDAPVAYVALSTVVLFAISSVLTLISLTRQHGEYHLRLRDVRLHRREVKDILLNGVPLGVMGSFMSLSNIVLQSAVNSFGELAIAGNTGANHINNVLSNIVSGFSHTSTIYCSKHYGAGDSKGFKRSLTLCLFWMVVCGLLSGSIFFVLRRELMGLFVESSEAVEYGVAWLNMICFTYIINGAQEIFRGALSALNRSAFPMISQAIGFLGFRALWVNTYFASHRSMNVLCFSYPTAWTITLILNVIFFAIFFRRHLGKKKDNLKILKLYEGKSHDCKPSGKVEEP